MHLEDHWKGITLMRNARELGIYGRVVSHVQNRVIGAVRHFKGVQELLMLLFGIGHHQAGDRHA